MCTLSSASIIRLLGEERKDCFDAPGEYGVHYPEVSREGEDGENHHPRSAFHLLPVRPGDAPHLKLQLIDVVPGGPQPVLLFFGHNARLLLTRSSSKRVIGRGGGIRTPTRGFGDRWSAVKPTPLGHSPRRGPGSHSPDSHST